MASPSRGIEGARRLGGRPPGWLRAVSTLGARQPVVLFAAGVLFVEVAATVLAPLLTTFDPQAMNVQARLSPPGAGFVLGSDHLGRDVWARILYGARVSFTVGAYAVSLSTVLGMATGVLAAYYRFVDRVVMRIVDGMMAFPVILLAIALMAALGPSLVNVVIALTAVYAPRTARIVRAAALTVVETPFVEAAHALGGRDARMIFIHVLPNCLSPVIVQATFTFAYAVQTEAALSFLGAGVPPSIPSWGVMLSEATSYMTRAPWTTIYPGIAVALTVLALNALGDGIRDLLDPRARRR